MDEIEDHEARLRDLTRNYEAAHLLLEQARLALVEEARAAHAAGMTMYRIARITGISQPGVKKWLTDDHTIGGGLALMVASLFGG